MPLIAIILILLGFFGFATTAEPVVVDGPDCGGVTTEGEASDGCSSPDAVAVWEVVQVGGVEGVIVSEVNGPMFRMFFTDVDSYWTPTVDDVTAAENAIAAEQGELEHMRQYVGFLENGEQKIYINGFCDAFHMNWQTEPVFVDDGGECYFNAVYNTETYELESFNFNGEA